MPRRKSDSTAVEQATDQNSDIQEVDETVETPLEQATDETEDENNKPIKEENPQTVSDQEASQETASEESTTQSDGESLEASTQQEQSPDFSRDVERGDWFAINNREPIAILYYIWRFLQLNLLNLV